MEQSMLTDADIARIANAFSDDEFISRLASRVHAEFRRDKAYYWVEPETHAEQHMFLSEWIRETQRRRAQEKRRADFWRDVKKNVVGWFIIVVLGGVLGGVGKLGWFLFELFKANKGG